MVKVSIIIPQSCSLESSIVRLCRIFDLANACLVKAEEGRPVDESIFSVYMVGATQQVPLYGDQLSVQPHFTLKDPDVHDIVIIPALAGNIADALSKNRVLNPWLIKQYRSGAAIAGCCTGAFFLANTHLAKDENCNKTWYVAPGFRKQFSQINDMAEKLAPEEDAVATENGAYTFINRLLQHKAGAEAAAACAELFEAEFNRECQSVFSISHKDPRPRKIKQEPLPPGPYRDRFYTTGTQSDFTGYNTSSNTSNSVTMKQVFRKASDNE